MGITPRVLAAILASMGSGGGPTGPVTRNLLVQYKFNEGSGSTVRAYDASDEHDADKDASFYSGHEPTWVMGGAQFDQSIIALGAVDFTNVKTLFLVCESLPVTPEDGFRDSSPFTISNSSAGFSLAGDGTMMGDNVEDTHALHLKRGNSVFALDWSTGQNRVFIDGIETGVYLKQGPPDSYAGGTSYFGWGALGFNYRGKLFYASFFDDTDGTALTDDEIAQHSAFMKAQVEARGVSLADPFDSSVPLVVAGGDSVTDGRTHQTTGAEYPTILSAGLTNPTRLVNTAVFGSLTTDLITRFPTVDAVLLDESDAIEKIYTVMIGYNDQSALAPLLPSQTLANISELCGMAKTAGATKTCVYTLTDADVDPTIRANMTTVNNGILAGLANVDFVVDLTSNTDVGVSGAAISGNGCYADIAHLTPAGCASVAASAAATYAAMGLT